MKRVSLLALGVALGVSACGDSDDNSGSAGASGSAGLAGSSGSGGSANGGTSGGGGTGGSGGSSGIDGGSGNAGSSGIGGTSGSAGSAGASGTAGSGGASGSAGSAGASGSAGSAGASGTAGSGGASGSAGSGGAGGSAGSGGASGSAGSAGTSGSGGSSGDGGTVAVVQGHVTSTTGAAISGMSVCVFQQPQIPCDTTDASGHFQLSVPGGAELLFEFTKTGYVSGLSTVRTINSSVSLSWYGYPSTTEVQAAFSLLGITPDPSKGHVIFVADDGFFSGTPGAQASMTPMSGTGPVYFQDSQPPIPNPALTSTTSAGLGAYANVNTGTVELLLDVPGGGCTPVPEWTWPGSSSEAMQIPVYAGYFTRGGYVSC